MSDHLHHIKRVLIVGGVAGGASCAARLRRMSESIEIIMFERGPYVSFANCGLPYYVGDVIQEQSNLLVATPELFRQRFKLDVRIRQEITRINRESSQVEVVDHATGRTYTEGYDVLVLSPGAMPIRPPLPGIDLPGVFTLRNIPDSDAIRQWMESKGSQRAVVVGGGFIGLEMTENLVHRGLRVTLLEKLPQVMPPMDAEMLVSIHAHLREKGVDLRLNNAVAGFERGDSSPLVVNTESGQFFPADLVILAIGVRPDVHLAKEAGLELGPTGGIRVDEQLRTSDPSIFAVGDAVEVRDIVTGAPILMPLAGPANRQGRLAADQIAGRTGAQFRGVQGTAVCGVFDLTLACTGASEKALQRAGLAYEKVYLYPNHHVGYYPGAQVIELKVLFSPQDGKVLGAQAVGREGVEKRIDVLALAIQMGATVYDLEESELCYAPQYGAAKDPVNLAGFIAANHLRGEAPLGQWEQWEKAQNHSILLDVRDAMEHRAARVPGAVHIPLDQLRGRLGELPRDRQIWSYCAGGQRSHYAVRLLRENGYDALNLSGGFRSYCSRKLAQGER